MEWTWCTRSTNLHLNLLRQVKEPLPHVDRGVDDGFRYAVVRDCVRRIDENPVCFAKRELLTIEEPNVDTRIPDLVCESSSDGDVGMRCVLDVSACR